MLKTFQIIYVCFAYYYFKNVLLLSSPEVMGVYWNENYLLASRQSC